jgi:uncharacterized Zn-binding protein involved in type VI secretion
MFAAARILDQTDHGGMLVPMPGLAPTVFVEGLNAAVAGDQHQCSITPPPPHPTLSPVAGGSMSVKICGYPAARAIVDRAGCGAAVTVGATSVQIGD